MADVSVEDQSEMDAPVTRVSTKCIGPFTIKPGNSKVLLELQKPVSNRELSLVVKVSGVSEGGKKRTFLNMSNVRLPSDPKSQIEVDVSEIL